ncbi:hypothetical protein MNV49_006456 [Pseudohyphozyma bogoriensis]|nr:hypothetical protein MNV49_006456 [Pseudohyphozyma bogoriensis]
MNSLPSHLSEAFTPTSLAQLASLQTVLTPHGEKLESTKVRQAAVLLMLFERKEEGGGLRVCLTTRAKHLRSHPFQTALPGGKVDPTDPDLIYTAFREAQEEVALPVLTSTNLVSTHTLGVLPPFISKYKIVCHPVVCVTTPEVIDALVPQPDEVDRVWEWPLSHVLDPSLVRTHPEIRGSQWEYLEEALNQTDDEWVAGAVYRHNRLRTCYTPLKGLTTDILLVTAIAAFGEIPEYVHRAPGQPSFAEVVGWVVKEANEAVGQVKMHAYGKGETNGIRA